MANRAAAEKELFWIVDMFVPGSDNRKMYEEYAATLDDKQFEAWMTELFEEREILTIMAPNLLEHTPNLKQAFIIADALEYPLLQPLILTDQNTGQTYQTANLHLCGLAPLRRQIQMLEEKRSVPSSRSTVDERSGQAAGGAQASRMSGPELQVNASKGLQKMLIELIKFRGGDLTSYNAMNRTILETGEASMDAIMADTPGIVQSNKTLSVYLNGAHLQNNLLKGN